MSGKDEAKKVVAKSGSVKHTTVKVEPFKYAATLYGKQVSPTQNDTVGKISSIELVAKDGKRVTMDSATVGTFMERFAQIIGASLLSFNKKHLGYLRTVVLNAKDPMHQDGRELHITYEPNTRFPLPGVVIKMSEAVGLAALVEGILQQSAEVYPPEVVQSTKAKAKDETETIEVPLY